MGGNTIEQLNIEGKRSGEGFITGKSRLVEALNRSQSERVNLVGLEIGRKGLVTYLKSLSGNAVKIVPDKDVIKVSCGATQSVLEFNKWIDTEKSPHTLCEVHVSPKVTVIPNMGTVELAEALDRVVPFTLVEDTKPVLNCVLFTAKGGKLTLVSADSFRLAIQRLDFEGEGEALVNRLDLIGLSNALRKARRVNLSFKAGERLGAQNVVIATECIAYEFMSYEGQFPDYVKLIPTNFKANASFSTNDLLSGCNPIKALAGKDFAIRLKIGNGKITVTDVDELQQGVIDALTDGESTVKLDGKFLIDALRACAGMVDLQIVDSKSPMLFSTDGYNLVVMPMTDNQVSEAETETVNEAETETEVETTEAEVETTEAEAEATEAVNEAEAVISEAEAETKQGKRKRNRKPHKEPVTV